MYKSHNVKTLLPWTPIPPPRSWHLVKHDIIGLEALENAAKEWIWNHLKNLYCMLHFASHVVVDLEWIERMYGPLLLNNNLLVGRDGTRMGISCVVRNDRRGVHNRMWYSIEPTHVPPRMPPRHVIRNKITPLLLAEDM